MTSNASTATLNTGLKVSRASEGTARRRSLSILMIVPPRRRSLCQLQKQARRIRSTNYRDAIYARADVTSEIDRGIEPGRSCRKRLNAIVASRADHLRQKSGAVRF